MARGLPYFPGSPITDGGGQVFNILAYGGKGNDSFLNDNALAEMTGAAVNAGGGTLYFPPGTYLFSAQWNLDQTNLLRFIGSGTNQFGSGSATTLIYTGSSSSSAISVRQCRGVGFEFLNIKYSNTSFTGYLVDMGWQASGYTSANCYISNCNLWPSDDTNATLVAGPAALLYTGQVYGLSVYRTIFRGGQYNVLARKQSYDYNNSVSYRDCVFSLAVLSAVKGGQNTRYSGGFAEPLYSGGAGFFLFDPTLPSNSITVDDMWMGDDSASVSGSWFTWGSGDGLRVRGGQIGCNSLTTGVLVNDNASQNVKLDTQFYGPNGGSSKGIDFGTTTGHVGFVWESTAPGITTPVAGTIPNGSIVNLNGTLTLYSPTISGNPTIQGTITANGITVSGAPQYPNVLSAATADFESGGVGSVGNWNPNENTSGLATTTSAALHGTHSLALTCTNSAPNNGTNVLQVSINSLGSGGSAAIPISPGQSWTAMASFYCPSGQTPRQPFINITIWDATLAHAQTLCTTGASTRDVVGEWTQFVTPTGVVPATMTGGYTPAKMSITIGYVDSAPNYIPVGEVHYVDCASLSQSSSTTWQDPAAMSATNTITATTVQFSGSGSVLSSGTGSVSINRGAGAGTGGVILGGRELLPDGIPTIAAGAGAGTSPTVSILSGGSDSRGTISITTGSAPTASATVATITLGSTFAATIGSVTLTPAGPNAAALTGTSAVWEDEASRGSGSFVLKVGGGGLQAATTYLFNYRITG